MRHRWLPAVPLCLALAITRVCSLDKNGVAPRAISLPSGPGSIQGLGESFQPQLNTGSASTAVKLALPRGPGGIVPDLSLVYDSGSANGALGLGWALSGMLSVRRSTDHGVPFYVDGPDGEDNDADGQIDNPEELDTFTGANGEELVTLGDGTFRAENEEAFLRYSRSGSGWEARSRDGRRYLFGLAPGSRVEESGRVFEWRLERVLDPNGNAIEYEYRSDPASAAQRHLSRIRWGGDGVYLALVLQYEAGRPDVVTSYRSGFELRTSLRVSGIDVVSHGIPASPGALRGDLDGDGASDALIRRYRLDYQPGVHLSLLERVTQFGYDGATALPELRYAYTPWIPPEDVAGTVTRSAGAPAACFESPSVELIDMNGDALPDLLSTSGSQHRVFLNLGVDAGGHLRWAPGRPVGNAPTIDIASDRTHLADATADGLSDLMVKVSNTSFLCFDNTSRSSWVEAPFPLLNTDTWPIWPHDGATGALSRSFDSDYSRTNDVLHTGQSGYRLWLLLPGGRFSRELRVEPLVVDGQTFRFDLPGTHIADLNGDRLQDLAWIQSSRIVYFPNKGRGSFADGKVLPLGRTLQAAEIERSDFSDIDGDGLVDLTVVRPASEPTGVIYWLNRFDLGLEGPRAVLGLPPQRTGDALRWADMNGNGTTDIVISEAQSLPGEKVIFVDLAPQGKMHLLREALNGIGRRLHMEYETSTAQMVRAEAGGQPWTSVMPIPVTVVGRIREDDGLSPSHERTLTYRDPYYDPAKQEFRGFGRAETREDGDASAESRVERFVFDTGRIDACLKGKQLSEEVLGDNEKLHERSLSTWRARVLVEGVDGRQVCFAFLEALDKDVHEGESAGVRIRSETEYDDYGNAITERRLGVADAPGDEVITERVFEIREAEWRLDLPSRERTLDANGTVLSERESSFDDRGNLVTQHGWLDTEERMVLLLRNRFDEFGNIVETTDPRGNRRTIAFDTLLHAWPTSETIHLEDRDLAMTGEYDLGLGVVTAAVTLHGTRTEYVHDPLGRLIERRDPGGAGEEYEYRPASPVSRVTRRAREDGGSFLESHQFTDGHGRSLGTLMEAGPGRWRAMDVTSYNARKLEARAWLPYWSATPEYAAPDASLPHETYLYDAMGRRVGTTRPDGSVTREVHHPLEVEIHDGLDTRGMGLPDVRRSDGLGRMIEVEERDGAAIHVTRYGWNARGELESIRDALGNTRRFRFNSLGRMVEADDPDRGLLRFAVDDAGNRIAREDGSGRVVRYTFDAANRSLTRIHAGAGPGGADLVAAAYHHDEPAGDLDFGDGTHGTARNTLARLAWIEDPSGEEHFSYDERGNVEWVLKRIRDPSTGLLLSFRTQRGYDLLGRQSEIVFPDNDLLRFVHGPSTFLERIDGGPGGDIVLSAAEYAPSGQPLRFEFGNGALTDLEYDSRQRLGRTRTFDAAGEEILHEDLTYDAESNVLETSDLRPASVLPVDSPRRRNARMAYDALHRLIQVRYGPDGGGERIDYSHDALGNLLSQSTPPPGLPGHLDDVELDLGFVAYAGGRSGRAGRRPGDPPGPHAITGTTSGLRLGYDASGNVRTIGGAELGWDFEDRMVRYAKSAIVADYALDHQGRRVSRRVTAGAARGVTLYIDEAFEVQDGSPTKYVLASGRRMALIRDQLNPARERVQRIVLAAGWNLVGATVRTTARLRDVFGLDASVYEPAAGSYAPLDTAVPVPPGKALWVHAPSGRVAVLRGLPVPLPAELESPGPLHLWPRLEPFRPAEVLDDESPLWFHDAATGRWRRRDPTLPSFLSDAPAELSAAQAFWSPASLRLRGAGAAARARVFHHQDHLESAAVLTDARGDLLEERSYHPGGAIRHIHRQGTGEGSSSRFDFADRERDPESGFVAMGMRGYVPLAGVFLSPDPRYVEAAGLASGSEADRQSFASFLADPQMGNLYSYALRNPLKYADPTGLDVVFSKKLETDRVVTEARALLAGTREGQRILRSINARGAVVSFDEAQRRWRLDPKTYRVVEVLGWTNLVQGPGPLRGAISIQGLRGNYTSREALIRNTARVIYHELRHAEAFFMEGGAYHGAGAGSRAPDEWATGGSQDDVHQALDTYKIPSDDPHQKEFEREIGLWTLEDGKEIKVEYMELDLSL